MGYQDKVYSSKLKCEWLESPRCVCMYVRSICVPLFPLWSQELLECECPYSIASDLRCGVFVAAIHFMPIRVN